MKHTKKFDTEWGQAIALLPHDIQGSLIEAIIRYQHEGIEPQGLHPTAQAFFIVIKPTIDMRARRAEYQRARRRRKNFIAAAPAVNITTASTHTPPATHSDSSPEIPAKHPITQKATEDKVKAHPIPPRSPKNKCEAFLRNIDKARSHHNALHKKKRYA